MNSLFYERHQCPVCGNKTSDLAFQISYSSQELKDYFHSFYAGRVDIGLLDGAEFNIQECSSCKVLYQKFIPNEELSRILYEDWVDPTETSIQKIQNYGIDHYEFNASEIRQLFSLFDIPSGKLNVLDFGMGWGAWAKMASAYGAQTYGYDFSEKRNSHAQNHGFAILDSEEIKLKKFDLINTEQVFEHIPNPLETMEILSNSLSQKGIIKISVPHAFNFKSRLKKIEWATSQKFSNRSINPVAPLEHLNFFNRSAIVYLGYKFGLKEIKIPLRTQYSLSSNFFNKPKPLLRFLFRPFMRNYFYNYILLKKL